MGRGDDFIARLARETLIADGAMGTELMARGLAAGGNLDAAPLRHPKLVSEVHAANIAAGAELLRTATFSANSPRLDIARLKRDGADINRAAVALAREAAGTQAVVAGSLGPCFAPADVEYTEKELEGFHAEQAAWLAAAGADLLICETFVGLREAAAALRGALQAGLPVIASLAPLKPATEGTDGLATADGVAIGPALAALEQIGAAAVGVNCGSSMDGEILALEAARGLIEHAPRVAFPNAGEPAETPQGLVYPMTNDSIAARAVRLAEAGAALIGGCCGTAPAAIAAIRARF